MKRSLQTLLSHHAIPSPYQGWSLRFHLRSAYARPPSWARWMVVIMTSSATITAGVNGLLRGLGAPELGCLALSLECSYEERGGEGVQSAGRVPGSCDPSSREVRLHLCGDGYELRTLVHELVHHLQFSGHAGVAYRREDIERFAKMLPYHRRPHEIEARWRAGAAVQWPSGGG